MMTELLDDPLSHGPSMEIPSTRHRIFAENYAQHAIVPTKMFFAGNWIEECSVCGKAGAQLREPCAMAIGQPYATQEVL